MPDFLPRGPNGNGVPRRANEPSRIALSTRVRLSYLRPRRPPIRTPPAGRAWKAPAAVPTVLDYIELSLLPALEGMLKVSQRADFCVGYFNLRGWKCIDSLVEAWGGGPGAQARVLVGMQQLPQDELKHALRLGREDDDGPTIDQQTALRLKRRMAEEFRQQLVLGAPTNADEGGLRRLSAQLKAKKVVVKLFLRHQLHAKLYLLFRSDPATPKVGYVDSSNLICELLGLDD